MTKRKKEGLQMEGAAVTEAAYRRGLKEMLSGARAGGVGVELFGIYDGRVEGDGRMHLDACEKRLNPRDLRESQESARGWSTASPLLEMLLWQMLQVLNYGFEIRPGSAMGVRTGRAPGGWGEWQWKHGRKIRRAIKEFWMDYLVMDGCIAFWRTKGGVGERRGGAGQQVLALRPEVCEYRDVMGVEQLKVRMGYTTRELLEAGFSAEEARRYSQREVKLEPAAGENFLVLTQGRTGYGFRRPRLESLFEALTTEECMEFADRCWALINQTCIRHWKLGHEIRNGMYAGLPNWFYKVEDGKALKKQVDGKRGAIDLATNFDRSVEYPFASLDRFKREKFEGVWERMRQWAGPVGMLFMGGQHVEAEVLQRLMKAWADDLRGDMKLFLEEVITAVFDPPGGRVEVSFGDEIFVDTRQFTEFVKHLMASGALSQRSGLEAGGFSQAEEWERKDLEHEQVMSEKRKGRVLPLYDPAHGPGTGAGKAGKPSGRPAGVKG